MTRRRPHLYCFTSSVHLLIYDFRRYHTARNGLMSSLYDHVFAVFLWAILTEKLLMIERISLEPSSSLSFDIYNAGKHRFYLLSIDLDMAKPNVPRTNKMYVNRSAKNHGNTYMYIRYLKTTVCV